MAERLPEPVVPLFPRFRLLRKAMKLQKDRKQVLRKSWQACWKMRIEKQGNRKNKRPGRHEA